VRSVALASYVIAIACAAGCGTSAPAQPPGGERVVAIAKASQVPYLTEGKDFTVEAQFPAEYRVSPPFPGVVATQQGSPFGLVRPGLAFGSLLPKRGPGVPELPRGADPSYSLALMELATGKSTVLAHMGSTRDPGYIVDAVRHRKQIVWVETSEPNMDVMPWRLYAVDLSSKRVTTLASHTELGLDMPPWPSAQAIQPQIVGEFVYLTAVESVTASDIKPAAYRVGLDGRPRLHKVLSDVQQVFADDDKLRFLRSDGQLVQWDPNTKNISQAGVAKVSKPCGAVFGGGVALQCTAGDLLITEVGKRHTRITPPTNDGRNAGHELSAGTGYHSATSRWVGFTSNDQAYVYDLKRAKLFRLKGSQAVHSYHFPADQFIYSKTNWDYSSKSDPARLISLLPR